MNEFPQGKILIVDDERTARYGMRKALNMLKAEVQEAEDGEEAQVRIAEFDPDVMVCDINMPKLNGLELLRRLSHAPITEKKLHVIVVTAFGSEKIAVEAMKAGAYDYLSKPYDIDELRLIVNKAAWKMKHARVTALVDALRLAAQPRDNVAPPTGA